MEDETEEAKDEDWKREAEDKKKKQNKNKATKQTPGTEVICKHGLM